MPTPEALRELMVDRLGDEVPPAWQEAMRTVPRHEFVPREVWQYDVAAPGAYGFVPLVWAEQPDRWLAAAYANEAVTTQVDGGHAEGPHGYGREATSSASMPLLVARMLAALRAEPGHRVLEIGTGTGYNAALLAHRLGASAVTSIEVDPALADNARGALQGTGYPVRVIIGDGSLGYPAGAPWDRIISTASITRLPHPWVHQTVPGGLIVTPWAHPYLPALLVFTVRDGHRAVGTVTAPGLDFMPLRGRRKPGVSVESVLAGTDPDRGDRSTTVLHPWYVAGHTDSAFAVGQRLTQVIQRYWRSSDDDECGTQWLLDPQSKSWARLRHRPEQAGPYEVTQGGPRRLWDEAEVAYAWWEDHGQPTLGDWLFEVSPTRQTISLRTGDQPSAAAAV